MTEFWNYMFTVYPNLVANIVWIPVVLLYHWFITRPGLKRMEERIKAHAIHHSEGGCEICSAEEADRQIGGQNR